MKTNWLPMRPQETADFLGISTTTLYDWIAKGHLRPGQHFVKIGKVRLFVPGPELIMRLVDNSKPKADKRPAAPTGAMHTMPSTKPRRRKSIDRDYLSEITSDDPERR